MEDKKRSRGRQEEDNGPTKTKKRTTGRQGQKEGTPTANCLRKIKKWSERRTKYANTVTTVQ